MNCLVRSELWILMAAISAVSWSAAQTDDANNVSVKSFGARGDGLNDDTRTIQAAINALELRGGGILRVPSGIYLLNSYSPSPHPWYFYNLRVGSNITIQADPGAKFLQGPAGRSPLVYGATEVRNSVLVFGSPNYVVNTFQDANYNGGFMSLRSTSADDQSVTLSTPSQAGRFGVGDYVVIYSTIVGDVVPSESSQVTSVSQSGALGLKNPLARAFSSPYIAKVTSLATVNTGVTGLIVQGAEPIAINEVFRFTATGNTFISDTSIGNGNTYGLNMNEIRGFTFSNNVVTSIGPFYVVQELPQRNSQDVVIDSNTFNVRSVGFGEYGVHWTITRNTFSVHPDVRVPAGLAVGGLDVLFSNNHVQGSTSGVPLMSDFVGLDAYASYVGRIRILNNIFDCKADQTNCLNIVSSGATVSNNRFNVTGNAGEAILVQSPLPPAAQINGNSISIQNGMGIVLNSRGTDNSVVSCNTITSGAGLAGIYVASPATPNQGKDTLSGNTVTGFRTPIFVDINKHPGTVIDGSTPSCLPVP